MLVEEQEQHNLNTLLVVVLVLFVAVVPSAAVGAWACQEPQFPQRTGQAYWALRRANASSH